MKGYWIDEENNHCIECSSKDCEICLDEDTCSECKEGNFLINGVC
jgi:hypothetical protein